MCVIGLTSESWTTNERQRESTLQALALLQNSSCAPSQSISPSCCFWIPSIVSTDSMYELIEKLTLRNNKLVASYLVT